MPVKRTMGKKHRKRNGRKRMVKVVPEDVINMGPLRIDRFGRFIRYSNTATPEGHAELLKRTEGSNKRALAELQSAVPKLQKLIEQYDAVELMHRAAYMLLPLLLKYVSESEYPINESYYLPTVEYLQYLIARTPANTDGKRLSEDEWKELWEQATGILQLTQIYLITRKTLTKPPTVIDDLRFILDSKRLGMRGDRYAFFFSDHLNTALSLTNLGLSTCTELTLQN